MSTRKTIPLLAAALVAAALLAGCGVAIDMAADNEWRWGLFGGQDFVSPYRLKVGVAPFFDDVGLGAPTAGANMARLMGEELAKDGRLEVVPAHEVSAAMERLGHALPLGPKEAAEVGRHLGLNAVVTGSISEVKKYQIRKGWRRMARILTNQRQYVDAVLSVSAVDSATGIVLVSRANTGEHDDGQGDSKYFETTAGPSAPTQEALESSLDDALVESFHRTLAGLATLPFKAEVVSAAGGRATIAAGRQAGLAVGDEFALLAVENVVTNTIGDAYYVYGAPRARLKVAEVGEDTATLEVTEGAVEAGDVIQAGESRGLFF